MLLLVFLPYPRLSGMVKPGHEGQRSRMQRTLEQVIPKNYDPLERPSMKGAVTTVHVSVHISHLEWKMDRLIVIMYLRQKWTDHRLKRKKPPSVLCKPTELRNHLWLPDTYLANSIEKTDVLNSGFIRVSSDGEVVHSNMLKAVLSCPQSLGHVLINEGVIECDLALESFAYSADEVSLKWNYDHQSATIDESYNGKVKALAVGQMTVRMTRGSYSRLSVNLTMDTGMKTGMVDWMIRRSVM